MPGTARPALSTLVSRSAEAVTVSLCGELDLATAGQLRRCLAAVVQEDPAPRRLVLDLSDLTFVDASGISALLTVQRSLDARGGRLLLRSPSRLVRRVVRVLDLEQLLPVET